MENHHLIQRRATATLARLANRMPQAFNAHHLWTRVRSTPTQALAKAEEDAAQAHSAKTAQDREYYERMSRKWLGIADGWRVITDVNKT